MKAILEFNLDVPEDETAYKRCNSSLDMWMVLWEYDQWLRSQIKYNDNISADEKNAYEDAREMLYEKLNEQGVVLDDL
jgi:hypothetical protein